MHHAAAEDLDPTGLFAGRASRALADLTGHIHLGRGLRERKEARAKARLRFAEEAIGEVRERRLEVDEGNAFIDRHPTIKVLALSFLLMVGVVLLAEGFGAHIPKGYIYGAMGFSVFVEILNIRTTRKLKAVELNQVPHVRDIEK